MRRFALFSVLVSVAMPGCFDPTEPPDAGTTGSAATTDGATTTASATTPTTTPADTTDPGTTTDSDATSDSDSAGTTTDPTATTTTPADSTGGGDAPTICDGAPTDLVACATAFDGTPSTGTVACDPTDPSFDIFYEDVFDVALVTGDCLYIRVDNIGAAGATGVDAADIALEIRSPSGAYGFFDDTIACTDPVWQPGGACPMAQITADVDGTYEIAITQASGAGCINPTPYSAWAAINGVELVLPAAPDVDEAMLNCAGA